MSGRKKGSKIDFLLKNPKKGGLKSIFFPGTLKKGGLKSIFFPSALKKEGLYRGAYPSPSHNECHSLALSTEALRPQAVNRGKAEGRASFVLRRRLRWSILFTMSRASTHLKVKLDTVYPICGTSPIPHIWWCAHVHGCSS